MHLYIQHSNLSLLLCSFQSSLFLLVSTCTNACILHSGGMGALLSSEDEPDVFEFNQFGRLSELQRRNTLCLPHMKSSYPVETQTASQDNLSDEKLKTGSTLEQMVQEVGE